MSFSDRTNLDAVEQAIRDAAARGVREGAEQLKREAQRRTPVLTGELRRSATVVGKGDEARVIYTDPIAVIVHEDMTARHGDGGAKFLERAMNETKGQALDAVASRLRPIFS